MHQIGMRNAPQAGMAGICLGHGHGGNDNVLSVASQAGVSLQTPESACACRFADTGNVFFVSFLNMWGLDTLAIWRDGSASDPRSEGWEFESLGGHFFKWGVGCASPLADHLATAWGGGLRAQWDRLS